MSFNPQDNDINQVNSFFKNIPKVEIHNHLEGSITPFTLHELAKKNFSGSKFAQSLDECEKIYQFTNFQGFLSSFAEVNKLITSVSDLDIIIKNNVELMKTENYKYIEHFLSVDTWLNKGMDLSELLDKVKENIKRHSSKNFQFGGIIIDFVRNYGPQNASKIMLDLGEIIEDYRDVVLGISIGGDEVNFPAQLFTEVFNQARKLNLKTTAHSGEADGSDSVWQTILSLKTNRIGHGLRCHESTDLLKHLRVTQTPLEMCPTSNIKTGVLDKIENHPIRDYYDQGINITINTDDYGFFDSSLSSEFEICSKVFHFSTDELEELVLNAAKSCFLPAIEKHELINKLKLSFEY